MDMDKSNAGSRMTDLTALEGKRGTDIVGREEMPAKSRRVKRIGRPFSKLDMRIVTVDGDTLFRVAILERELVAAFGYMTPEQAEAHLSTALGRLRALKARGAGW